MTDRKSSKSQLKQEEINTLLNHFPQGLVTFDVETTGLSPWHHEIIEIAAIKLKPTGSLDTYHQLFQPRELISHEIIEIHGIHNEDLVGSPRVEEKLHEFISFVADMPLMAHNAPFDCGFILKHAQEAKIAPPNSIVFDSLIALRDLYKKSPIKPDSFKLSSLADFFNIELEHHRALDDAMATLCAMAKALVEKEPNKTPGRLGPLNQISMEVSDRLKPLAQKLKAAIEKKEVILILYDGGSHRGKFRPVRPIALLPSSNGSALYAQCELEDFSKSFSLKKIKSIKWKDELEEGDRCAD